MNGHLRQVTAGDCLIEYGLCAATVDPSHTPDLIPRITLTREGKEIDLANLIRVKSHDMITERARLLGIEESELKLEDRTILFLQPRRLPYERDQKRTASTRVNLETGNIEIILHGLNDKSDIMGLVHEAAHAIAILSSNFHNPAKYIETTDYRIRAEVDAWFITHELLNELGLLEFIFEDGEEGFNEFVLNRLASELPLETPVNDPRTQERKYGLVTDSGFYIDYMSIPEELLINMFEVTTHENYDFVMGFSNEEVNSLKGKRVLEVGPGRGVAFAQLMNLGVEVYALEPQLQSVLPEWQERLGERVSLIDERVKVLPIQQVSQAFPSDDEKFDVIFAQGVNFQRYANSETDIQKGISEAVAKLNPDGFMTFEIEAEGTILFGEGQEFNLIGWLKRQGYKYEIVLGYRNVTTNLNASFIRIYNPSK